MSEPTIDEQIKYQREPWGSGEHESAILASLEELKRIREVPVPEEPEEVKAHLRYADPYDHVRKHIDTLRDLLKRETARADSYVSGAELAAITILRERAEAAEAKLAAIKEQSHD